MKPDNFKLCTFFALLFPGSTNKLGIYPFDLHIHRFAGWTAGRAASTSTCRFSVEVGIRILETALSELLTDATPWPHPARMDEFHRKLRNMVIATAATHGLDFTHGIAAKLINVYMKTAILNRHNGEGLLAAALHPPIDSEMLNTIADLPSADNSLWRRLKQVRWSKFSSEEYEDAIAGLRRLLGEGKPLWMAEQYWGGFSGAWRQGKKQQ